MLTSLFLECVTACHVSGMPVSAMKAGSDCYCLEAVPTNHLVPPQERCGVPCAGDSDKICGGHQAMQFYIASRELSYCVVFYTE